MLDISFLRSLVRAAIAIGCLTACAPVSGTGGGLGGGSAGFSRRDERQRIGSFSTVQAVAVSRRFVYAASGGGIAVYDRVMEAWLPPLTRDQGLIDQQITVIAGDPVEEAVWFGVPGAVVSYRPQTEQLQRTIVTGVPEYIAFDRGGTGDAFVRSAGQWTRISRIGLSAPLAQPPVPASVIAPSTLNDLYTRFPTLRTQPQLLLREQAANRPLRQFALLSGAASPERVSDVWLGTDGDGLYRLDPTLLQAQALRFGLLEPGVGALALAADGVWVAGLGVPSSRGGLTFATSDLQQWRWLEGTISTPLTGLRAYTLATRAERAWMGTDRGLVRLRLDGENDVAAWTTLDGLPDDRVLAVAPRDEGAWVGTRRGLQFVSDSARVRSTRTRGLGARLLDNTPVYALLFTGDTLWAGTESGLLAIPRPDAVAGGTLARPRAQDPALRRPVRSLAWSDTVLLAATDDAVLRLAPRGGVEPVRIPALDVLQVGQVTRVAIDNRAMWLAGTTGVVMLSRQTGALRVLRVPADVPGPVLDLVASRDWLWLGTPQGLVRYRRTGDGLVP
ncbi:MAG: hypothetical protein ACK5XT_09340 [Gemmatimonas sp.]|uniref:hypothetical protein n=1 Tax=Gemmatimonas sp. TaxID=1962908 RepID=UPI00391F2802